MAKKVNYPRTEAVIRQRERASRKHGVYAIQERGEDAMEEAQRGRYAELREQLQEREGILSAMIDQAATMLVMVEAAQSYVVDQAQEGKPLGEIPMLRNLPAFWNSTNRALQQVLANLPGADGPLDITAFLRGVEDGEDD